MKVQHCKNICVQYLPSVMRSFLYNPNPYIGYMEIISTYPPENTVHIEKSSLRSMHNSKYTIQKYVLNHFCNG